MKDNISQKIEYYRNTILSLYDDYLPILLENKTFQELLIEFSNIPSEMLFKEANNILEAVENGLISDEKMLETEFILLALFTAIEDYSKVKVKTF